MLPWCMEVRGVPAKGDIYGARAGFLVLVALQHQRAITLYNSRVALICDLKGPNWQLLLCVGLVRMSGGASG